VEYTYDILRSNTVFRRRRCHSGNCPWKEVGLLVEVYRRGVVRI
jgi:hypothetical protein